MRIKYITCIIICTVLCACTTFLYSTFFSANILVNQSARNIVIPYGSSLSTLRNQLARGGYIKNMQYFDFAIYLLSSFPKILAGNYELQTNISNLTAIRMFKRGLQKPVKITLYGISMGEQLVTQLTKNIGVTPAEFQVLLNDADFIGQYGFTIENSMTMFIPNTYEVYWTVTAQGLFDIMYRAYRCFWNKERLAKAAQLKMTPIEITILASIIEKESNKLSEAPIIAGVYINRLRSGMRLYSCPTLVHILEKKKIKRVLKKDLWIVSPYNTYRRKGLPPGPITVPAIATIDAVLNYKKHHYLYFSAREDLSGYHYFTNNYNEHLRNACKYKRILDRNKIFR